MRLPTQAPPVQRRSRGAAQAVARARSGLMPQQYCAPGQTFCPPMGGGGYACCNSDQVCAYSCDEDDCNPYCESSCFPSGARVRLSDGATKAMCELEIGDRVEVVHADGTVGFDEIYLFTHKDADRESSYRRLELATGQVLVLSPRHFLPTVPTGTSAWRESVEAAADEVEAGDRIWHLDAKGKLRISAVVETGLTRERGAYNPLTAAGTIVVGGVAASVHSDWFLDGVVSVPSQVRVYQAIFAPVRGLYAMIGARRMRSLAEESGIVDFVRTRTTPRTRRRFAVASKPRLS
jgi:hypothetical protein